MVEQKIPPEVWAIIFQTLNFKTRLLVKQVCWVWKDIIDTNFLKYRVALSNENCHQVLQSTVQFEKMEILNLTNELSPIVDNAVKSSLIQINHKSPKCIVFKGRCQKSCPSLVPTDNNNGNEATSSSECLSTNNLDVIFGGGIRHTSSLLFERNSLRLLTNFPQQGKVTKRKKSRCRQSNGGSINNKSDDEHEKESSSSSSSSENVEYRNWTFSNLQYLLLDGESGVSKQERFVFERITSVKMSMLRKVQLCWLVQSDQQENEKTYLLFYQLLVQHRSTLKDVTLFHVFTRGHILKKESEVLLPKKQMMKLRDELSKLQLDKLIIQFDRYEGFRIFTLGHHLVSCQSKLKTLGVSMRSSFEYNVNQIRKALEKNKDTIKEFLVESREKVNGKELQAAVCSCRHLEFLKMINIQLHEFPTNLPSSLSKINLSGHLNAHENLGYIFQLKHLENFRYLDMQEYNLIEQSRISSHLEKLRALGPQLKYLLFHAKNIPFDQFCQRGGGAGGDGDNQIFKAGRATFVRRWYFPTKVIYFKDLPYLSLPQQYLT